MINRRQLLSISGAAVAGAGLGLAGCTSPSRPGSNGSADTGGEPVRLPTYLEYEGVKPDEPGSAEGALPYFKAPPMNPTAFLSETPGDGSDVGTYLIVTNAPVPLAENSRWQALNDMLGVNLGISGAVPADYVGKFHTLVAGGDLPDIVTVLPTRTTKLPSLLDARFTDLTEYLSGDAIADYPALANIPTFNWPGSVFNNRIFLVPKPHYKLFRTYLVRTDVLEERGVDPHPASGDDLLTMLKGLSDPAANRFAVAHWAGMLDMVNEMMGTPNDWAEDGGRFTKDYESETFAEALDVLATMWSKNYVHPDAFGTGLDTNPLFVSGQCPVLPSTPSWSWVAKQARDDDPDAKVEGIALPRWDGSKEPVQRWEGEGTPYRIGIPKTDPERVKMLLRVINALASPFGTQEYATRTFGVEGVHYNRGKGGTIEGTEEGKTTSLNPVNFAGAAPPVHYNADPVAGEWEYEQDLRDVKDTVPRAQIGLVSPTDLEKGAALRTQIMDVVQGVVQGRSTAADWKQAVKDWRSNGGDQIRNEYEKALEEANG